MYIPVNAIQYSEFLIRWATCSASFFSFSYESWISAVFNASLIMSPSALVIPEALSFDNLLIKVCQQTSWNVANPSSFQFTWKSDKNAVYKMTTISPIKLYRYIVYIHWYHVLYSIQLNISFLFFSLSLSLWITKSR